MSSIISANLQDCGFLEQSACLELDSFMLSLVKTSHSGPCGVCGFSELLLMQAKNVIFHSCSDSRQDHSYLHLSLFLL